MEASVQYNDLRGTAAADVSDYFRNSLQHYLSTTYANYDDKRYFCEGFTLWAGDCSKTVNVGFVCKDKQEDKYVKFVSDKYTFEQLSQLFKRFNVVIGTTIEGIDVCDDDWLDLK